jgi:hypothetical protein
MTEKRRGNPLWVKGHKEVNHAVGRPKGSKNKYSLLAREMMTERGPDIVQKVVDMAMDGDVHCLKMCIDRILPVHKAVDSNRTKQDSKIIINVGASTSITEKIADTDPTSLIDPSVKTDDAVIIEVSEAVK